MTQDDYRAKWGLARDYPMVAPGSAAKRSETAKAVGLGRKPAVVDPRDLTALTAAGDAATTLPAKFEAVTPEPAAGVTSSEVEAKGAALEVDVTVPVKRRGRLVKTTA